MCHTHLPSVPDVHAFIHVTQANIVRCEAIRHFRDKNKECLKAKVDEL